MSYNYRCTRRRECGARKTLRQPIERYHRRPVCPACGRDTLKTVNDKEKSRNRRRKCTCDGYPFPHHKGTEPWCIHALRGPTDEDYEGRYGKR
jgi:hypothetical protein